MSEEKEEKSINKKTFTIAFICGMIVTLIFVIFWFSARYQYVPIETNGALSIGEDLEKGYFKLQYISKSMPESEAKRYLNARRLLVFRNPIFINQSG